MAMINSYPGAGRLTLAFCALSLYLTKLSSFEALTFDHFRITANKSCKNRFRTTGMDPGMLLPVYVDDDFSRQSSFLIHTGKRDVVARLDNAGEDKKIDLVIKTWKKNNCRTKRKSSSIFPTFPTLLNNFNFSNSRSSG